MGRSPGRGAGRAASASSSAAARAPSCRSRYMGTRGVLQGSSMDRRFVHPLGHRRDGRHDLPGRRRLGLGPHLPGGVAGHGHRDRAPGRARRGLGRQHGLDPPAPLAVLPAGPQAGSHHRLRRPGAHEDGPRRRPPPRLRPGSDGALALGMLHVIFAEGLEDAEFLAEPAPSAPTTCGPGPPSGRVERSAAATGLPPDAIADFARRFAAAQPAFIKLGPGAQRHADAGQAFRAVLCPARRHRRLALPRRRRPRPQRAAASPTPARRWNGPICGATPGPPRQHGAARPGAGRHRTTSTARSTPSSSTTSTRPSSAPTPPPSWTGLARDDLFTVVAEHFMTETARYADVVLPATTQLEHLDVVESWGHRYLTLNRPAIAPARPVPAEHRDLPPAGRRARPRPPRPARTDDEALLATYLDGVRRRHPRRARRARLGQGRRRGSTLSRRSLLRSDAMARFGLDPLPDADGPPTPTTTASSSLTPKSHHFLNSSCRQPRALATDGRDGIGAAARRSTPPRLGRGRRQRWLELTSEYGAITVHGRGCPTTCSRAPSCSSSNWWHEDFPGGLGTNALTGQELTDVGGRLRAVHACAGTHPARLNQTPRISGR